eukprot:TRINITY_DN64440_c0_g1_i1.p1 TRINITY_DN64440_c0_g1~~TRINITY_DN64440_c0_g1_i1.p1  ORF type:complete len:1054 (-),score=227.64 TRINITY_DN64440_c0_g1_i1:118-3279(-)
MRSLGRLWRGEDSNGVAGEQAPSGSKAGLQKATHGYSSLDGPGCAGAALRDPRHLAGHRYASGADSFHSPTPSSPSSRPPGDRGKSDVQSYGEPLHLLRPSTDRSTLELNPDAMASLEELGAVCVVSILGNENVGKSTLMNYLYHRRPNGFPTRSSNEPETQGIWVWPRRHPFCPEVTILFLDIEGLDSEDSSAQYSQLLTALALFMSDATMLMTSGCSSSASVRRLESLLEVAGHLWFGNSVETRAPAEELTSKRSFFWVRRDYKSRPGRTSQLALLDALEPEQVEDVKRCFGSVDVFGMPRPGTDATLRELDMHTFEQLAPEFQDTVLAFEKRLFKALKEPRRLAGQSSPLSGGSLVLLLRHYLAEQTRCASQAATVQELPTERAIVRSCAKDTVLRGSIQLYKDLLVPAGWHDPQALKADILTRRSGARRAALAALLSEAEAAKLPEEAVRDARIALETRLALWDLEPGQRIADAEAIGMHAGSAQRTPCAAAKGDSEEGAGEAMEVPLDELFAAMRCAVSNRALEGSTSGQKYASAQPGDFLSLLLLGAAQRSSELVAELLWSDVEQELGAVRLQLEEQKREIANLKSQDLTVSGRNAGPVDGKAAQSLSNALRDLRTSTKNTLCEFEAKMRLQDDRFEKALDRMGELLEEVESRALQAAVPAAVEAAEINFREKAMDLHWTLTGTEARVSEQLQQMQERLNALAEGIGPGGAGSRRDRCEAKASKEADSFAAFADSAERTQYSSRQLQSQATSPEAADSLADDAARPTAEKGAKAAAGGLADRAPKDTTIMNLRQSDGERLSPVQLPEGDDSATDASESVCKLPPQTVEELLDSWFDDGVYQVPVAGTPSLSTCSTTATQGQEAGELLTAERISPGSSLERSLLLKCRDSSKDQMSEEVRLNCLGRRHRGKAEARRGRFARSLEASHARLEPAAAMMPVPLAQPAAVDEVAESIAASSEVSSFLSHSSASAASCVTPPVPGMSAEQVEELRSQLNGALERHRGKAEELLQRDLRAIWESCAQLARQTSKLQGEVDELRIQAKPATTPG